jgi:hypothetical protein
MLVVLTNDENDHGDNEYLSPAAAKGIPWNKGKRAGATNEEKK